MNRPLKSEYFINQFQEHRHNPKAQWNMINTLSGRIKPRTEAKAPLSKLAKTFTSVVTDSSRPQQLPIPSSPQPVLSLGAFRLVSSDTMLKYVQHVNPGKATGSDDIPPVVLKRFAPALSGPLTGIINESLTSGVVPDVFKLARVCPLFKGGDPKNPSMYRPILLLLVISKLPKKIVHEQLTEYFEECARAGKPIIPHEQFAYRAQHSCEDALALAIT